MSKQQMAIAIRGAGSISVDQLKLGDIVMDNQAHRLILRRANQEGISESDALEKTIQDALREYFAEKR
jgi:hypothetical protein